MAEPPVPSTHSHCAGRRHHATLALALVALAVAVAALAVAVVALTQSCGGQRFTPWQQHGFVVPGGPVQMIPNAASPVTSATGVQGTVNRNTLGGRRAPQPSVFAPTAPTGTVVGTGGAPGVSAAGGAGAGAGAANSSTATTAATTTLYGGAPNNQ